MGGAPAVKSGQAKVRMNRQTLMAQIWVFRVGFIGRPPRVYGQRRLWRSQGGESIAHNASPGTAYFVTEGHVNFPASSFISRYLRNVRCLPVGFTLSVGLRPSCGLRETLINNATTFHANR